MIKKQTRWRQNRNRAFLTAILLLMVALLVMIMIQGLFSLIFAFQLDEVDARFLPTVTLDPNAVPDSTSVSVPAYILPTPNGTSTNTLSPHLPGKIVFTCTRDGYNHICTINPDGTALVQQTRGVYNDYYATLTHDGTNIIFVSNRTGKFQIYTMNLDGSDQRMIPVELDEVSAPDLSPDRGWIVFSGIHGGNKSIYFIRPDGSDLRFLFGPDSDIDPNWSRDGSQISFASNHSGLVELFTINPDGSNLRQVTNKIERIGGRNSWSPDGEWLSFYAGPRGDRDVYAVEIATGRVTRLTSGGNNTGPCFSSDGNWIVFSSSRDGDHELYIMRRDGSDLRQLTFNDEDDWQPRWGP